MSSGQASGQGSPMGSQLRCHGGCSQLKPCLGLEDPLPEWVAHMAVKFMLGVIQRSQLLTPWLLHRIV